MLDGELTKRSKPSRLLQQLKVQERHEVAERHGKLVAPSSNKMELQETLTSILNLIWEVNSRVSGISPIKIRRPGRGYILCLSSYFRLRLLPWERSAGLFHHTCYGNHRCGRRGRVYGGEASMLTRPGPVGGADPVSACFMVGEESRTF